VDVRGTADFKEEGRWAGFSCGRTTIAHGRLAWLIGVLEEDIAYAASVGDSGWRGEEGCCACGGRVSRVGGEAEDVDEAFFVVGRDGIRELGKESGRQLRR
jgi:hypothetical protein